MRQPAVRLEDSGYTLADVVTVRFGAPNTPEGSVTGVIVSRDDEATVVRMYSARCLHDDYPVPTGDIREILTKGE